VVQVGSLRLRISRQGHGPSLLLLGGLGNSLGVWDNLVRALPDFDTIAVDAPGTGSSSTPLLPLSMAELAELYAGLVRSLDLDRVSVLGLSFGGAVAQQFAYQSPELVGRLVLCGTGVVLQVLRGKVGQAEDSEDLDVTAKTDWVALAKLVGFVVLHIFLIEPAGWPVAAAVLFSGAAWSLDAKPLWKAIGVSVILALVLQYVFGGLLGVSLPPGPLLEGVPFFHG